MQKYDSMTGDFGYVIINLCHLKKVIYHILELKKVGLKNPDRFYLSGFLQLEYISLRSYVPQKVNYDRA